jgi:hypothetical protein
LFQVKNDRQRPKEAFYNMMVFNPLENQDPVN